MSSVQLYPYQQRAVDKLSQVPRRLIGDEMGLGKTVTALAMEPDRSPCLIICPKTVVPVWTAHIEWMFPEARVAVCARPADRERFAAQAGRYRHAYDFFVCYYEAAKSEEVVRAVISKRRNPWPHLIVDECHRLSGYSSRQSKVIRSIRAEHKTALSGTPSDDKPQDLWAVLNFLYPQTYTSYWRFVRSYVRTSTHPRGFTIFEGPKNVRELQSRIAPFFIRRRKREVRSDLPEVSYQTMTVDLGQKQRTAYDQMSTEMVAWLESDSSPDEEDPMFANTVLARLTRLSQFAVAYSRYEGIRTVHHKDGTTEDKEVYTSMEPSAKLDLVEELISDTDQKVVVFSQFRQIPFMLQRRIGKPVCVTFTGGEIGRETNLEWFWSDPDCRVLAATLGAGSEGIDLTAASLCVFVDKAWNPNVNEQAVARIDRPGQQNPVQVVTIQARATIDQWKFDERLPQKAAVLAEWLGDTK